jgi:hypothetical protein
MCRNFTDQRQRRPWWRLLAGRGARIFSALARDLFHLFDYGYPIYMHAGRKLKVLCPYRLVQCNRSPFVATTWPLP